MDNVLDTIKKVFQKLTVRSILTSIILILIAILLITNPGQVLTIAVILAGIGLIVSAIVHFVAYFGNPPEVRAFSFEFLLGVLEVLAGIVFMVNPPEVIGFFYIIIGAWLIVESIQKIAMAINLSGYVSNWAITIVVAILDMLLGILVLAHPYAAGTSITQVTGIILLVSEACNLVESIYTLVKVKKINKVEK